MSNLTPFYQDDLTTIYHGDCEEIAPKLGRFDLLLTDPPYGLASKLKMKGGKNWANFHKNYNDKTWDEAPPPISFIENLLTCSKLAIIWGGNYIALPPARCWLVWNKMRRNMTMGDAEIAWTNFDKPIRIMDLGRRDGKRNSHPTQKPLALMHWCLNFAPDAKTVFDPYMGSGTTLLAAKQKGIKSVGIEREIEYCQLAVDRLSQTTLNLFA